MPNPRRRAELRVPRPHPAGPPGGDGSLKRPDRWVSRGRRDPGRSARPPQPRTEVDSEGRDHASARDDAPGHGKRGQDASAVAHLPGLLARPGHQEDGAVDAERDEEQVRQQRSARVDRRVPERFSTSRATPTAAAKDRTTLAARTSGATSARSSSTSTTKTTRRSTRGSSNSPARCPRCAGSGRTTETRPLATKGTSFGTDLADHGRWLLTLGTLCGTLYRDLMK